MLKIRLSRGWKHKRPFFRIVLTEHTKPVKSGYKQVLWWFDPINHKMEANESEIKEWIKKWAQPSERVAKLMFNLTNDELFKKYYEEKDIKLKPKKENDSE